MTSGTLPSGSKADAGRLDRRALRTLIRVSAVVSAALGLSVMYGWHSGNQTLVQVMRPFAPMQYNTALAFFFCGAGLLGYVSHRFRLTLICGSIAGGLGFLTLLQYIVGVNFGIDELLMTAYITVQTSHPGRMAPNTALSFLLSGIALLIASTSVRFEQRSLITALLSSVVVALGTVAFLGYVSGIETTYGWGRLTQMAVHAAAGFIVVGAGLFALAWLEGTFPEIGMPRWLPIPVALTIATLTLGMWQALVAQEQSQVLQLTRQALRNAELDLAQLMEDRTLELRRIAQQLETGGRASPEDWRAEASSYVRASRGYQTIAWIDSSFRVRSFVSRDGNEGPPKVDLALPEWRQAALESIESRRPLALLRSIDPVEGKRAVCVCVPIFPDDEFGGFVFGTFRIETFFPAAFQEESELGFLTAVYHGAEKIFGPPEPERARFKDWLRSANVAVHGATWRVEVWPGEKLLAASRSALPTITAIVGFVMTFLVSLTVYLAQTGRHRAYQVTVTNRKLEDEISERKRAEAEIDSQQRRLSVLHETNLATTSTLDLQSVLRILMDKIIGFLPNGAVLIWLIDEETGAIQRAACRNVDEHDWKSRKLTSTPALVEEVIYKKTFTLARNVQTDPRTLDSKFHRDHGFVSYLGVPLVAKEEILGVVVFLTREDHEFTEEEIKFLSTLAGQAAMAVKNSQLYGETRQQAKKLEEASRLQADFMAMIAHDLRSPLNNVIGVGQMLHEGALGPINEEQKKWLDRLVDNGRGLVEIVSDFLDISKLEAGGIELAIEPVVVEKLLLAGIENFAVRAEKKHIALKTNFDESLRSIPADPRRLEQVLGNLLSNAVKFTPQGGTIEVGAIRDHTEVSFWVKDSGVGIARDELSSLFQKYVQTASGKMSAQGTGLGLVICKMIVEAHGGRIWAESTEGQGATFTFTLPAGSLQ